MGGAGQYAVEGDSSDPDGAISAPGNGPCVLAPTTLAAEFEEEPTSHTKHFFIAADPTDEIAVQEIAAVDTDIENPELITTFLTLPAVAPHASSRRHDPIMDFTKSVMLMSDEYVTAALEVHRTRLALVVEKEQDRQNREEAKKRKLEEREEANRIREIRAQEVAKAKARKLAEREEAQHQNAMRLAEQATARAVKALEKARRATE